MKVLLFGGTGLLSSEVLALCVQNGYDTSILNRGNNNQKIEDTVKTIKADFYNQDSVEKAVQHVTYDIVVDFLSRTADDIKRIFPVFSNRCKQYIFISSACVYQRSKEDGIITEESPKPNMDWKYNIEKYESEQTLIALCKQFALNYTIVRPYITYGDERIPFGLAPDYGYHWTLVARILAGKPFFVWDKGDTITTLTHVEDFAKGIVGLFDNVKAYNQDFHVVTTKTYTWKEMLTVLFKILNRTPDIVEISSKNIITELPEYKGMLLGDRSIDTYFDNSKIMSAVDGLEFSVSLEEGLRRTIEHYKRNNYLKGIDYKWDAKIDKLISRYSSAKLHFVDYLGHNKKTEKIIYFAHRYLPIRVSKYILWFLNKAKIV